MIMYVIFIMLVFLANLFLSQVKAFEAAHAQQVNLRKEAEDTLRTIIQEQEKLLEEREVLTGELQKAMRNITVLESRAQDAKMLLEN